MKTSDLIFIGIRGSVIALNHNNGERVWATRLKGISFVNVMLEAEKVLASCYGEIFCLDALTGKQLWHNPLKGYGLGLATMATDRNPGNGAVPFMAENIRREQANSAGMV